MRVFGKICEDTSGHRQNTSKEDIQGQEDTSNTNMETENVLLKQEVCFLKYQLEAAQEREKWFQTQITTMASSFKSLEDKRPKKRFWFLS